MHLVHFSGESCQEGGENAVGKGVNVKRLEVERLGGESDG
jgi:hypothetical protein